jgi:putative ABC transport system permease protein
VTVRTEPGAAGAVGRRVSLALDPRRQAGLSIAVPPSPEQLRGAVERQTQLQMAALAITSLVAGAIGVSNTMLVGVLERRHEIGVRRAVGASAGAILQQFLLESAVLGATGGVLGSLAGALVTVVASIWSSWPVALPWWLLPLTSCVGLVVGVLAGCYPALRAARIQPIEAMTSP